MDVFVEVAVDVDVMVMVVVSVVVEEVVAFSAKTNTLKRITVEDRPKPANGAE